MESTNSASGEPQTKFEEASEVKSELSDKWFSEKFDSLLPEIQRRWPDLAKQTLEATKGSLSEVIRVISEHSGKTSYGVEEQLSELLNSASAQTKNIAETLEPLEKQLEELLDELNETLRPRIEKPVRERPILSIGIAAGIGLILGILISGGKRS